MSNGISTVVCSGTIDEIAEAMGRALFPVPVLLYPLQKTSQGLVRAVLRRIVLDCVEIVEADDGVSPKSDEGMALTRASHAIRQRFGLEAPDA